MATTTTHRDGRDAVLHARRAELPGCSPAQCPGGLSIQFKPEVFGEGGEVQDESTAKFLRHYMEEYSAFVQRGLAANAPGHIGDPEPDPDKLSR
ncbi:hypothetical protein ABIB27_001728 [Arthrobacter sp. UYEF21]